MRSGSYFGIISQSYRENRDPHTISPDRKSPDVYDVTATCKRIMDRLDDQAARECFSDMIRVDRGGWAYKVTKEQAMEYNRMTRGSLIPEEIIEKMKDGEAYGIIDAELC